MIINHKLKALTTKNLWSPMLVELIGQDLNPLNKELYLIKTPTGEEYECYLVEYNNREFYVPLECLTYESNKLDRLLFKKEIGVN